MSHKLIINVKRRGRKRKLLCSTTTFSPVYNISIGSCLCATETISSPAAVLAVLRSVLDRVGIMTREEQGMMPGKKSIPQEIRCKPSSCCRETDLACAFVCVWVSGWETVCDSACEVQLNSPVEKGELKQITFPNKVSVQMYLCVRKGRVRRWCSPHNVLM